MSYTIEYNPELRKSYPFVRCKTQKRPIKFIAYTLCTLLCVYLLETAGILYYVIPGEPSVTAGAFSVMVEEVRLGQTVPDAIFAFFREVIKGGMPK